MGADLTIIDPSIEAASKLHNENFERLVRKRNAVAAPAHIDGEVFSYLQGYTPYVSLSRHSKAWLRTPDGKAMKAAQKAIDENFATQPGYFRDSYNNSSLMWRLNLSWWQLSQDGLIDDDGILSVVGAKALRAIVKAAPLTLLSRDVQARDANDHLPEWVATLTDKEIAEWNKYFASKKRKFIAFLTQAINLNAKICCSV